MDEQVNLLLLLLLPDLIIFSLLKFNQISIPNILKDLIQQLIDQHKKVYKKIEDLHDHDHHLEILTEELTHTVETLV
jgi:hypothetical protein